MGKRNKNAVDQEDWDRGCLGRGTSGCLRRMTDGRIMDVTPMCSKHLNEFLSTPIRIDEATKVTNASKEWEEVEKILHGFASRLWIPPTPEEKELYDKVIPKLINRMKSLYKQNIQLAREWGREDEREWIIKQRIDYFRHQNEIYRNRKNNY